MPTLRFKIKGVEFEYIGEEDEIVSFVNRFLSESIALPVESKQLSPTTPSVIFGTESKEILDEPAPPDEDLIKYITSKPDFAHDLFEIQEHFFGMHFSSRDKKTQRMYHRTARQLRLVRQLIEKKYEGKFIETKGTRLRGLKRFVFKKSPVTAWGQIGKS